MSTQNESDWDSESYPIKEVDTERCIEKLKLIGEVRSYSKGAVVSQSGAKDPICFVVLEGSITAQVMTEDGKENQYISHRAGQALLEAQCFCEWVEVAEFSAAEHTKVLVLKRPELLAAIEKDPELSLFFIGTLSMKFRWYVEHCRNLCMFSAMRRLCDLLLEMAKSYGEIKGGNTILKKKISQEDMAKQLHVNRLTILRCMKELRDYGMVGTENGYYSFPDLNALKKFGNES